MRSEDGGLTSTDSSGGNNSGSDDDEEDGGSGGGGRKNSKERNNNNNKSKNKSAGDNSGAAIKPKREKTARGKERAAQKEIRRAYYRKSLQWHPDRWAGMGMYALAVQGAFELINEGYNILTTSGSASSATTGANSDMNVNSMNSM